MILEVAERWKMRDGRIAVITHRLGSTCAGQVEDSIAPMLWVDGKCDQGKRYDIIEQIPCDNKP